MGRLLTGPGTFFGTKFGELSAYSIQLYGIREESPYRQTAKDGRAQNGQNVKAITEKGPCSDEQAGYANGAVGICMLSD